MSNVITSGSLSDWVFSKPVNPVGEYTANHGFFSEFTFKAAAVYQGTEQSGSDQRQP